MNTGSSTSYRRAPGETTEWEDILISKGIIAPKTDPEEEKRQAALEERLEAAAAAVDPLKNLSLSELDELEEEGGSHSDDNKVLESYRAARLAQLQAAAARNKYGALFPLSRPDFVKEVTEASQTVPVVVLLYKDAVTGSRLLEAVMARLAAKHKATKFMKIVSDSCIENYPDANVPTLFIYKGGAVAGSVVGLGSLGGTKVTEDIVEWALSQHGHGAVTTELDEDPRGSRAGGKGSLFATATAVGGRGGRRRGYGSDSDDDEDDDR